MTTTPKSAASPQSSQPPTRRRLGLPLVLALLLGLALGRYACNPPGTPPAAADPSATTARVAAVWTCSMHPQIRMPEPGDCPICGMDLIPVPTGDDADDAPGVARLSLSPAAVALAEIVTAPVERRAVAHEVRMIGKVGFDETAMASITAWVPGRLDRLFVDYTGVTVRKGDHLVEIYSPQLLATQQELLQAVATARLLAPGGVDSASGAAQLVAERTSA